MPVAIDGFRFPPAAGLGSWDAFKALPDGSTMVMGDTGFFEDEITPATDAAFAHGLDILFGGCRVTFADKLCTMNDQPPSLELYSTLTCPRCGLQSKDLMPTNACQYYYDCKGCGTLLKPLPTHCCVYCSYGDVKCPPMQQGNSCCARIT